MIWPHLHTASNKKIRKFFLINSNSKDYLAILIGGIWFWKSLLVTLRNLPKKKSKPVI